MPGPKLQVCPELSQASIASGVSASQINLCFAELRLAQAEESDMYAFAQQAGAKRSRDRAKPAHRLRVAKPAASGCR